MRIGFIATRLSGTDGVSLEVEKWARVLQEMGHELFYCAGELGGYAAGGKLIPRLHFNHPDIDSLNQRAFGIENPARQESDAEKLGSDINAAANELQPPLREFIRGNRLDMIIIENALASVDSFDHEKVAQEKKAAAPSTEIGEGLKKVAAELRAFDPERLTLDDVREYVEKVRAL